MALKRDVGYADSGSGQVAYEVFGSGPRDVLLVFEWGSSLDWAWELPRFEQRLRDFAEFARVIRMDMGGSGLSDPSDTLPPLEEWVGDVNAVLDAVGSRSATLVGQGHAAQLCMLFAAMHPEATDALVTLNGFARFARATDYPWGYPPKARAALVDQVRQKWGTGGALAEISPSMAEGPHGMEWLAKFERAAATPRRAALKQAMVFGVDVRDVLPSIAAPTLVIQAAENHYAVAGHGRFLAENIPGAKYFEVSGSDHGIIHRDFEPAIDAIRELITGSRQLHVTGRSLMTVAFTDIVDSTGKAAELGDRRWRSLLEVHESIASREIESVGGRLVKLTGDGLLATFDGPARAVNCMQTFGELLEPLGLPIRAGVHTGEVEQIGDDIGGIAVHIAARISALAGAGEILTSSTVRDLVAGSGLEFDDRGEQELKGVPGTWRVLAVR
jgi:class 3 adenylate cyclase/pimeloyl-ACP methyl ester carboxylesterase